MMRERFRLALQWLLWRRRIRRSLDALAAEVLAHDAGVPHGGVDGRGQDAAEAATELLRRYRLDGAEVGAAARTTTT